jgi:hypothetical protein
MKNSKSESAGMQVARLLRALAALVEKSDPDEVAAFLRSRVTVLSSGVEWHAQKGTFARATAPPDLPKLAQQLRALNSRDEGHALLSSASLTRRELEKLGRLVETPILKTDNMERLAERIIEASIGSRLSSAAIRGNHTKPIP